eukprot:1964313-Pyramimonas_sp.AAC.1
MLGGSFITDQWINCARFSAVRRPGLGRARTNCLAKLRPAGGCSKTSSGVAAETHPSNLNRDAR